MGSSFSWLDFSEHERRKALDIIDMFRERQARDELGIGTVRDALSDVLFPGVSTIQTRARYFLFVPWIYRALEHRRGTAEDIERFARRAEICLIDILADSPDTEGVIGIEARESLKRLPSNVYWQGLYAWGPKTSTISQSEYHRFFASFVGRSSRRNELPEDDGDRGGGGRGFWHEGMPDAPGEFPEGASFALLKHEAEYLRERLLARQAGKLLSWLVDRTTAPTECAFPWEHPQLGAFAEKNRIELEHARLFSLTMHGAVLIYNLQLWELLGDEEWITRYQEDLEVWANEMEAERAVLAGWNRAAFWWLVRSENPRISLPTYGFVNAWFDLVLGAPAAHAIGPRADARNLIASRERRLKGPQSRFENQRAREIWGGESGAYRLSFRWFQAQRIVNDIVRGLQNA